MKIITTEHEKDCFGRQWYWINKGTAQGIGYLLSLWTEEEAREHYQKQKAIDDLPW